MTVAIDTSALVAVVFGEPDAQSIAGILTRHAGDLVISAATVVEASIVVESSQGPEATADLRLLLAILQVEVVPFDEAQALAAVAAWQRFGKGRHPASLNLGKRPSRSAAWRAAAPAQVLSRSRPVGVTALRLDELEPGNTAKQACG